MITRFNASAYILVFSVALAGCHAKPTGIKGPSWDYEPGKTFADFHRNYISVFKLNAEELQVVGDWNIREQSFGYVVNYYLAPNHEAFMSLAGLKVKSNGQDLGYVAGIWEVREGVVYIRVYILGYAKDKKGGGFDSFPQMTDPFETAIINVTHIHPDGYSLKPFAQVRLPKDVERLLVAAPNYSANYMYRSLRSLNELSGSYSYTFEDIDFMARYPDAHKIFENLATYQAYIAEARAYRKSNR